MAKPRCPFCWSTKLSIVRCGSHTRRVNRCNYCRSEWTDQSRTIFKYMRLAQWKRDVMLAAIKENPEVTCIKLSKIAQVQYKTAWSFKRRIIEGPEAVRGYWQGKNRLGRERRTRKECAGLVS